jgi:hypothetical protein
MTYNELRNILQNVVGVLNKYERVDERALEAAVWVRSIRRYLPRTDEVVPKG